MTVVATNLPAATTGPAYSANGMNFAWLVKEINNPAGVLDPRGGMIVGSAWPSALLGGQADRAREALEIVRVARRAAAASHSCPLLPLAATGVDGLRQPPDAPPDGKPEPFAPGQTSHGRLDRIDRVQQTLPSTSGLDGNGGF